MSTHIRDTSRAAAAPAALFNEFLTKAAKNGALDVVHCRVIARQPDNEIFVRKALVAMWHLAPEVKVTTAATELVAGHTHHGHASLAEVAASHLRSVPGMDIYTTRPRAGQTVGRPSIAPAELFVILHAYAYREMSGALRVAPDFGLGAASVAAGLSGQLERLRPRVHDALDSAYAQAFSDVHAIVLIAAFNGNAAALDVLAEVIRRREAGGDFSTFSLAPLSQDSRAALEILRHELRAGKDFTVMSCEELLGFSTWVASEGLGAWLEKHGASLRCAASITSALETATRVVAAASAAPRPGARQALRPN